MEWKTAQIKMVVLLIPEKFESNEPEQALNVQFKIDSDAEVDVIQNLINQVKERCPVNDNLANPTPIFYFI